MVALILVAVSTGFIGLGGLYLALRSNVLRGRAYRRHIRAGFVVRRCSAEKTASDCQGVGGFGMSVLLFLGSSGWPGESIYKNTGRLLSRTAGCRTVDRCGGGGAPKCTESARSREFPSRIDRERIGNVGALTL